MRHTYTSLDGRWLIRPFDDSSAGRGARVPRGWIVTDTTGVVQRSPGGGVHQDVSLSELRARFGQLKISDGPRKIEE